jgi:hypothetical protein
VINLQEGDCWLWSLIIFLIHRSVSAVLPPHSLMGRCGGDFPPTTITKGGPRGGQEGATTIFLSPPGRSHSLKILHSSQGWDVDPMHHPKRGLSDHYGSPKKH